MAMIAVTDGYARVSKADDESKNMDRSRACGDER